MRGVLIRSFERPIGITIPGAVAAVIAAFAATCTRTGAQRILIGGSPCIAVPGGVVSLALSLQHDAMRAAEAVGRQAGQA